MKIEHFRAIFLADKGPMKRAYINGKKLGAKGELTESQYHYRKITQDHIDHREFGKAAAALGISEGMPNRQRVQPHSRRMTPIAGVRFGNLKAVSPYVDPRKGKKRK